jgi:hypothetical protein
MVDANWHGKPYHPVLLPQVPWPNAPQPVVTPQLTFNKVLQPAHTPNVAATEG